MDENERIEKDDFLFGIGVAISEIVANYIENQKLEDNQVVIMSHVGDGKKTKYDKDIEELRVICENEGFCLVATKYFMPISDLTGKYGSWTNDEIVLMRAIDYEDTDKDETEAIEASVRRFREILNYFKLDDKIERLNYYLYFPEKIIIDENGNGICDFTIESEWEHEEKYGEHKH